jgi:hypothetical protein
MTFIQKPQVTWVGHSATNCKQEKYVIHISCCYTHILMFEQHYIPPSA